jgi:hypothetical protein
MPRQSSVHRQLKLFTHRTSCFGRTIWVATPKPFPFRHRKRERGNQRGRYSVVLPHNLSTLGGVPRPTAVYLLRAFAQAIPPSSGVYLSTICLYLPPNPERNALSGSWWSLRSKQCLLLILEHQIEIYRPACMAVLPDSSITYR